MRKTQGNTTNEEITTTSFEVLPGVQFDLNPKKLLLLKKFKKVHYLFAIATQVLSLQNAKTTIGGQLTNMSRHSYEGERRLCTLRPRGCVVSDLQHVASENCGPICRRERYCIVSPERHMKCDDCAVICLIGPGDCVNDPSHRHHGGRNHTHRGHHGGRHHNHRDHHGGHRHPSYVHARRDDCGPVCLRDPTYCVNGPEKHAREIDCTARCLLRPESCRNGPQLHALHESCRLRSG